MNTQNVSLRAAFGKQMLFSRLALGATLAVVTLAGCKGNANANPADGTTADSTDPNAQDPTLANMAPVDPNAPAATNAPVQQQTTAPRAARRPTQVAGYQEQAQPTQQSYSNPAPVERRDPNSSGEYSGQYADQGYNSGYNNNDDNDADAGYAATLSDISAPQPPPPLPVYEQPEAPEPNYLWTPGYWSYAPQGYYWVPGAWTQPPYTGALWTPGYWGGYGDGYRFHRGFWAAHIGFYGGIDYGFGYVGTGYQGGYWNGNNFYYNQYANHVNPNIVRNVYQRDVTVNNTVISNRVVNNTTINNTTINNRTINNVSYNGGQGGLRVQPRPAELAVLHEQRVAPMTAQLAHQQQAAQNRQQFFAENHGRPAVVVAARPLAADRGIAPPPHTTAQINRSVPVPQQIRQEQQFVRPAARPVNQPAVQRTVAQPQNHFEGRPEVNNQARPGQVVQPGRPQNEGRPAANAQPVRPEPTARPTQPARTQPTRPEPARTVPSRTEPARTEASRPQPARTEPARPQPSRPQPQTVRPQPEAHPQPVRPQAETHTPPARPETVARAQPRPTPPARPVEQHAQPARPQQDQPHAHR